MKQHQGILTLDDTDHGAIANALDLWISDCVDDPAEAAELHSLRQALLGSDVYLIPRAQA